jgi:hypothetical protein
LLPPKILLSEKKTKSKLQTTHPVSNHPKKKTLRLNNIHTPYSSPTTQEKKTLKHLLPQKNPTATK